MTALPAHPSPETLAAFVERRLPGAEREAVLAHCVECPECRAVIAGSIATTEEVDDDGA